MSGSQTGTVIIVEDDPSMCQALNRILRLGKFVPVMYGSAEALLDDGPNEEAICMILDVQLPGIDAFALHERLVALGSITPVIFITAFDDPEARARAAKAGAAFLSKPFSGRILLERIRSISRTSDPGGSPVAAGGTPC